MFENEDYFTAFRMKSVLSEDAMVPKLLTTVHTILLDHMV